MMCVFCILYLDVDVCVSGPVSKYVHYLAFTY